MSKLDDVIKNGARRSDIVGVAKELGGRLIVELPDIFEFKSLVDAKKFMQIIEKASSTYPKMTWKTTLKGNDVKVVKGSAIARRARARARAMSKREIIATLLRAKRPDLANRVARAGTLGDPNKYVLETKDTGVILFGPPTDFTVQVYWPLDAIGRRGKKVKVWSCRVQISKDDRVWWPASVKDALKKNASRDQIIKAITGVLNQAVMESKRRGDQYQTKFYPSEEELKGVDPSLPEPTFVPKFEDQKGRDIRVTFKKPLIKILSEGDQKRADQGHMRTGIDIKWHYARKVARIAEELAKLDGLGACVKLLRRSNVKYDHYTYMDPMWA